MKYIGGFLFLMLWACGPGEFDQKALPEAVGKPGELVIICDNAVWEGAAGAALQKTYGSEQVGLPQPEPWFRLIRFDEGKFNNITRKYRTILLVTTLDNDSKTSRYIQKLLGERQHEQQLTDSNFLFVESADRWAKGQQVLYLIGKDEQALGRAVLRKRSELLGYLNKKEIERVAATIQKKGRNKELEQLFKDSLGLKIAVPQSYKVRTAKPHFVWISREDADKSLNLFVSRRPYSKEEQFTAANLLFYKDGVTRREIPGPSEGSWYTTEYLVDVDTFPASFADNYALKMRGLWRVENDFMGGPFYHFSFYDSKSGMLVSAEGFVFYPKEKKRELLRELEAIIQTIALP